MLPDFKILYITNKRKFSKVANPELRLIADLYFFDTESKNLCINIFNELRKVYPNAYAYESLSSITYKGWNRTYDSSDWKLYDFTSIDLDTYMGRPIKDKDINVINAIKTILIEDNIHSDLQHSPHGYHLIVKTLDAVKLVPKISYCLKSIGSDLQVDCLTNVKALEGMWVDDFQIFTEKNWT